MRHINNSHWLAQRFLLIGRFYFACPYCHKTWDRGGKKEGFVKVAATRHAHGCYEAWLYKQGYVDAGWENGKTKLLDIDEAKVQFPRAIRSIKATIRRRARRPG